MALTQAHIAKVYFTIYSKIPDHYLSQVTWIGMILHTIIVAGGGGAICPIRKSDMSSLARE